MCFFCANEGVRSEIHSPNPFRGLGLTLEAMDVSIPGSPNPGWGIPLETRRCSRRFFVESEFGDHIVADDFHIKSWHCRFFSLQHLSKCQALDFDNFFQCWWQHGKLSFTCRYWLFIWQACRPTSHQGRKAFAEAKSGHSEIPFTVVLFTIITCYQGSLAHMWLDFRKNLLPAWCEPFCQISSILCGHIVLFWVASTPWHLSSFCLSPFLRWWTAEDAHLRVRHGLIIKHCF